MRLNELTPQQKDKLLSAQDPDELEAFASEEGIALSDELLEDVAGGWDVHMFDDSRHVYPQGKPSVIC